MYKYLNNENILNKKSIHKIQLARLKETVNYCKNYSPYYREKLKGFNVNKIKDINDISLLPFTEKDALSSQTDKFVCLKESEIADIVTTSGSTGKPLIYKMSENDLKRLAYNEFLCFKCVSLTKTDTVILAVTMDKCFIAGLAYFSGLREIGASTLRVGPTSIEMLLQTAISTKASAVIGVPSYLLRVSEFMKSNNILEKTLNINKIVCIGEPVRNRDFTLNHAGKQLSSSFNNARIFSTYGITELAVSFCECTSGIGGHAHPEIIYTEIVDENSNVLGSGKEGEVVATVFGVSGMPLIRYKTGDISFIINEQCSCGLRTSRLGPIIGRKQQKLKFKGTTVYPQAIINTLESIKGITNYCIIATSKIDLSDNVDIKVSLNNPIILDTIKDKLRAVLKVTPIVTIMNQKDIDTLKSPAHLRKKASFIDKRQKIK